MQHWVIGDIHGCLKTFRTLVEERIHPSLQDRLYLLGDYVSKGPDSKGVIDYIWQLEEAGYQVVALQGNHEEMLLNGQKDPAMEQRLLEHGGEPILQSFGVKKLTSIPAPYVEWMEKLPLYIILEHYVLVHAGLNFQLPDPFSDEHAMRWSRMGCDPNNPVRPEAIGNRSLIHGHTPVALDLIQAQLQEEPMLRLDLDNGCAYPERPGQGGLAAFELGSRRLLVERNVDQHFQRGG